MSTILSLTLNPTIDKSTSVSTVASEVKMRCEAPEFHPGGGGINVSRAIKKLGGDSVALYTEGGSLGQMLTELLHAEGITTRPQPIAELTRENLTVYEDSSGLQYRFGMPGPALTQEEWEPILEAVAQEKADYVVASGSLPPGVPDDFYAQLARRLQDEDSRLIVDTSGGALSALRGTHSYLLKPNLRELELLSGVSFEGEQHVEDLGRALITEGWAEVLVISMGASGAVLVTAEDCVQMRPPVVPIKSKVGAGDSMVGGLVWALAEGKSLNEAVRYGIAAGSAAVMTPGTELCRAEDVFAIYERVAVLG